MGLRNVSVCIVAEHILRSLDKNIKLPLLIFAVKSDECITSN